MSIRSNTTFEERCRLAIDSLRGHRSDLHTLQEANLLKLEELKESMISEADDSPELQKLIERWTAENNAC